MWPSRYSAILFASSLMVNMPGATPFKIITKIACDEHRVRIFNALQILARVDKGELQWVPLSLTPKSNPFIDHNGQLCTKNEMKLIVDPRFPKPDQRHTVVKTHRHITDVGTPGASGKYDPKTITTPEGVKYQPIPPNEPNGVCELCEAGDMIPPWDRFRSSKYKPSLWRFLLVRASNIARFLRVMIKR